MRYFDAARGKPCREGTFFFSTSSGVADSCLKGTNICRAGDVDDAGEDGAFWGRGECKGGVCKDGDAVLGFCELSADAV